MNIHEELANVRSTIRESGRKVKTLQDELDQCTAYRRCEAFRQIGLRVEAELTEAKATYQAAVEREADLCFEYAKGVSWPDSITR